jgi:Ca2+/Na+ antiporter
MLVYVLLVGYLIFLYATVRTTATADENENVLVDAKPIRPLEWARAIGLILIFVGAIALTKYLLS